MFCSGWFVLARYLWSVLLRSFLACALLAGSGLVWFFVSPLVLDLVFSDMFYSALVWSTLSFSHQFGRSASFWAGLVRLCPVRFVLACFGLVCDALLHTVYSCSFVLVTVARI